MYRIDDVDASMPPTETTEDPAVEALRPERDPCETCLDEVSSPPRIEVLRIGLERDLGPGHETVTTVQGEEHLLEHGRLDVTRRPTAEVDRMERGPSRRQLDLGDESIDVPVGEVVGPGDHGEVAVRADCRAERDVDVSRPLG
jgi:hypothetical protein